MLDTWLSLLPADCSTFRIVHPVLVTDLTRCSTLSVQHRLRIAPLSTPYARAVHGLLRVQHSELLTGYGLLRIRRWLLRAALGLLLVRRLAPLYRSRIAPCPILDAPCRSTDCSVRKHFAPLCCAWIAPCSTLQAPHRTRLLCARRLALHADRGVLRALYVAPYVDCGLLRRQYWEFCVESVDRRSPSSTLITPPRP